MKTTTIQIDVEVRDQLRVRGRMGETYNDVIRRLLAATRSRGASYADPPGVPPSALSRPWVPQRDRV